VKSLRRAELWAALVVFALLALHSIIGAFLGADRAGRMFTSVAMWGFWIFFAVLVLAGLVTFPRLLRSPALLLAHLGFVLVMGGAFWASQTGNRLEAALTGRPKLLKGYMGLNEGETSSQVMADAKLTKKAGSLPFSIHLDKFTTEYYPVDKPWMLIAQVPTPAEHPAPQGAPYVQVLVDYAVGKAVPVPHTNATVKVLQYLPHAQAVYARQGGGTVKVTTPDGAVRELPAAVGATLSLDKPKVTVRVVQVFGTLRVMGMGENGEGVQVVDVPGPPQNPAVKLEVEHADGARTTSYAYARMAMHGQNKDNLQFDYALPEATSAEPAPEGSPALQYEVRRGDQENAGWLIGSVDTKLTDDGARFVVAPQGDLLALSSAPAGQAAQTALYLAERLGDIKAWKSTVSVVEEGATVLTKTVEMNHPLSYGGYRFYQDSYRPDDPTFTQLSVASDSGVWLIYLGFVCLGASVFWWMWVQPILRRLREGGEVVDGTA
jgi:hypothetical protein